jgi:hypothetical protein
LFLKKETVKESTFSKKEPLTFNYNKITQEKLTNTDQLITVVPFSTKDEKSRALLLKIDNTIHTIVYSEYPDTTTTKKSFSGIVIMTTLDGDFIRAYRLKNNEHVTDLVPSKNKTTKTVKSNLSGREIYGGGIELNEVIIQNNYTKPTYTYVILYLEAPSEESGGGETYEFIWNSGGGGSGDAADGQPIDEEIINELTGKEKCLNALLDKNGDSFVKNLLANFEGKSEFNIQIVSKDKVTVLDINGNIKELNGSTTHTPGSTLITIEISTSRTNEHASLEGARTILHEYIHADIFRKLNTASTVIGYTAIDFKKTYDEYENHHGNIAALYLNSMKEALKEFHKNVLTDDYNNYTNYYGEAPTDAFYEALAWGGLRDNNVKSWADLPAEKKAAIEVLANRVPYLSKTVPCPN